MLSCILFLVVIVPLGSMFLFGCGVGREKGVSRAWSVALDVIDRCRGVNFNTQKMIGYLLSDIATPFSGSKKTRDLDS
ncbi:hypothetical protein BKA60DRAFT_562681, partial [Fusarium oxysporum]